MRPTPEQARRREMLRRFVVESMADLVARGTHDAPLRTLYGKDAWWHVRVRRGVPVSDPT